MKFILPALSALPAAAFVMGLAACASSPGGGLAAGKFVSMQCADARGFQARLSEDGRTVRVRAHPGSAELESQGDGRYAGEGYALNLRADGGASLDHEGKSQGKACKAVG